MEGEDGNGGGGLLMEVVRKGEVEGEVKERWYRTDWSYEVVEKKGEDTEWDEMEERRMWSKKQRWKEQSEYE